MSSPITVRGQTTLWPTTGDTGYSNAALQTIQNLAIAIEPIAGLLTTGKMGVLALNNSNQLTWTYSPGGPAPIVIGNGTVTSISVVSANGLAGTVANASTTPAITLTTSVTGVLKGNGTAISAATAGTDYSVGTSALATGISEALVNTLVGILTSALAIITYNFFTSKIDTLTYSIDEAGNTIVNTYRHFRSTKK